MPTSPSSRKRPWHPERKSQSGRKIKTGFYQSMPWRRLRNVYIANNPLCVMCKAKGIITRATVVDHIRQINREQPYNTIEGLYPHPLDAENLQSLCESCHNRKSGKERHKSH